MRAGQLHTEIVIEAPPSAETPLDEHGQPSGSYTTAATVNGEVIDGPVSTDFVDDQFKTTRQVQVKIRYYADLTEKHRLTFDGRTVVILGVRNDAKKTETMIDALEIVS
jgi:head-tail adaptor